MDMLRASRSAPIVQTAVLNLLETHRGEVAEWLKAAVC